MNYCQEIDGFGERSDIALERDREYENRIDHRDHEYELLEALDRCGEWSDEQAPSVKFAIDQAIDSGLCHVTISKKDYCFDYPDTESIRYEILIERGWSCSDFQIIHHEQVAEFQFEVSLIYPEGN